MDWVIIYDWLQQTIKHVADQLQANVRESTGYLISGRYWQAVDLFTLTSYTCMLLIRTDLKQKNNTDFGFNLTCSSNYHFGSNNAKTSDLDEIIKEVLKNKCFYRQQNFLKKITAFVVSKKIKFCFTMQIAIFYTADMISMKPLPVALFFLVQLCQALQVLFRPKTCHCLMKESFRGSRELLKTDCCPTLVLDRPHLEQALPQVPLHEGCFVRGRMLQATKLRERDLPRETGMPRAHAQLHHRQRRIWLLWHLRMRWASPRLVRLAR